MLKLIGTIWGVVVGATACMMIERGFHAACQALDTVLGVFH